MMTLNIALNEFRYMFFSLQSLIMIALFFGLSFLFTANGVEFQSTARGGNVFINSPYIISKFLIMLSLLVVFIAPAFIANTILKDQDNQFDVILYSTPMNKLSYLVGRFSGGFLALICVLFAGPAGMYLGTYWPWAEPEIFTENDITHYLFVFFIFVIPSVFTVSTIVFSVAITSRNMLFSYFSSLALLILFITVDTSSALNPLWDPFMGEAFAQQTQYWTAAERNTKLLSSSGIVIENRLLWLLISLVTFLFAYSQFSFQKTVKVKKQNDKKRLAEEKLKSAVDINFNCKIASGNKSYLKQLFFRTKFEILCVFKSKPFLFLMACSFFILYLSLTGRETAYDVNSHPFTRIMLSAIYNALTFTLMAILAFYSADIIWRERHSKINEIIDALPVPNWVFVTSKVLALALVMHLIVLLGIFIAISLQLLNGHNEIQLARYLGRGLIYYTSSYFYLAILTCFFQVLTKNRLLGMLLFVVFMALLVLSKDIFEIEHILLSYGVAGIAAPLSDMNINDRFVIAGVVLRVYWGAIAGILLMLTYILWNRGTLQPLKYRLKNLRLVKSKAFAIPTFILVTLLFGSAGTIFYNTNILNQYRTSNDIEQLKLKYEQKYRQYENLPMPSIVEVNIDVDIFPYQRRVEARSKQVLKNKTNSPIKSVHLTFASNSEVKVISLQGAELTSIDDGLGYFIFELNSPMQPGEERTLTFESIMQKQGFRNSRRDTKLVRNGTFITNDQLTPHIGFFAGIMNEDRNTRKKLGLPPLPRLAKLEDESKHNTNGLRHDSDFIKFETTVSTVSDQIAVSSGHLVKKWRKNGRQYFHYKMDAPMMNFYSFFSAEYEVATAHSQDTEIQVFHHRSHTYNVERILSAAQDSLKYFSREFSPYQYRNLKILEFPDYRKIAQSFPNTIGFSEGMGFIADVKPNDIDLPYFVTAHEIAHQWWGYQVMAADVQGGMMLIESLSQYSALTILEKKYGKHQTRKFLKHELDKYLRARAHDSEGELPLYKVEGQPFIHYRKGGIVMYALRDYLGEDIINNAIRKLINNHIYQSKPYAISTDFIRYLKEESPIKYHQLIEDFLEKITLFDLKVNKSVISSLSDGRYKVLLEIEASKFYENAIGEQTQASFDLPIDIGLFIKNPQDPQYHKTDVILLNKHSFTQGLTQIELIVDKKPLYAGIDPYHKLIDRNSDDNIIKITE